MLVTCRNRKCEHNNLGFCNIDSIGLNEKGECLTCSDGTLLPTASEMGKKGGSAKTEAKSSASRENGKLGGRPRRIKDGYVSVYKHRGIDICTLKEAETSKGDSLKYLAKTFLGENEFDTIQDAIDAINKDWE